MAETITEITLNELPEKVKKFSRLGQVTTRKKNTKSGFMAQVAWYHSVKGGINADILKRLNPRTLE